MIVRKRTTARLPLVEDESCNEKEERTQGECDSQTTLSVGCYVPMSAAKTDSPFICALVLFSRVRRSIKYAGIFVGMPYVCQSERNHWRNIS